MGTGFRLRRSAASARQVSRPIAAVLILAVAAISVHAEDWPQFRGPTGQGHSAERGLPLAWSETRNVVWKTPVAGVGWSSPVVAGGRVWVTTAIDIALGTSVDKYADYFETCRRKRNVIDYTRIEISLQA